MYLCTKLHGFFQSLDIRNGFIPDNVEKELCRTFHRHIPHPVGIAHQSIVYAQDRTGYKGRVVLQIQLRHESNQVCIFYNGKVFVRVAHYTLYVQFGKVVLQVLLKGVEYTFAYIGIMMPCFSRSSYVTLSFLARGCVFLMMAQILNGMQGWLSMPSLV